MTRFCMWVLVAAAVFALASGCSAQRRLQQAQQDFLSARDAGAEARAPYEFYAAESYLQLAEHEYRNSHQAGARLYAGKSQWFSHRARTRSEVGQ